MLRPSALLLLLLASALPACTASPATGDDVDQSDSDLSGDLSSVADADANGRVSVRAGVLTLTFDGAGRFETRGGERSLVLTGTSSRNLKEVRSFVPDDAFGQTTLTGPRTFEIALRGGHEINSILSGLPLGLAIVTQNGSPARYEAALTLGARLVGADVPRLHVVPEVRPVSAGADADPLRYRSRLELTSTPESVTVAGATVSRRSAQRYDIDWTYDAFAGSFAAPAPAPVTIVAKLASGTSTLTATVALSVVRLGLTTKTIEQTWPAVCQSRVRSCIARGASLAECGSFREVQLCKNADPPPIAGIAQAEARIRADVLAKTGVAWAPGVLSIRADGARNIALTALGRGGSAEFAIGPGAAVSLLRFVARPSFADTSVVQRFEPQLHQDLGLPTARIVATGKNAGPAPLWQFVVDQGGARSTIALEATSANTSALRPFTYDVEAFRGMASALVVEHGISLVQQAGVYAELEVYLRAMTKLATASGLEPVAAGDSPVGFDAAKEVQLVVHSLWGDVAVYVTIVRATGAIRVADFN